MATIEIRTFTEADRAELRELYACEAEGSPVASLWGHPESEASIYLDPYLDLEPESLFLAVVDGKPAGHLAGCVDSAKFPGEDERIERAIRSYRLYTKPKPMAFFARASVGMALAAIRGLPVAKELDDPRWPAQLHIAVTPAARGTGAAHGLMDAWLDRLRSTNTPGCYLQTQVQNVRAVRFFERSGFTKYGEPALIPGMRWQGKPLFQQTMVWTNNS
ncbi:GNAT family N-acetyltransferase [Flindersiella endophytica]